MKKNNLKKDFIETLEPLMLSNGFSRKGKVFHRIVNGKIVQLMSHFSFFMAQEFTVQFSILPLCWGGWELDKNFEGTRIYEEFWGEIEWWSYDGVEGYKKYLPVALEAVEDLLMPKFNKEIDYESYYKSYRESRCFIDGTDKYAFRSTRYIFALVFGDYEDAKKATEEFQKFWRKRNIEDYGTEYDPNDEREEWFQQTIVEYARIKEAMDKGDKKTIEEYISSFEQKSLDSYVKIYSTPKKYEKFLETGVLPFDIVEI